MRIIFKLQARFQCHDVWVWIKALSFQRFREIGKQPLSNSDCERIVSKTQSPEGIYVKNKLFTYFIIMSAEVN